MNIGQHLCRRLRFWARICLLFVATVGCESAPGNVKNSAGGGSEVGNPPVAGVRTVKGKIVSETGDKSVCDRTQMEFADSRGKQTVASFNSACELSAQLTTDQTYEVTLLIDGQVNGTPLIFVSGDSESSTFYLGNGVSAVDLGVIAYDGTEFVAENDPAQFSDADGDGLVDSNDRDDDNDGVFDVDEADCDEDGISDDFDLSSVCSSETKVLTTTAQPKTEAVEVADDSDPDDSVSLEDMQIEAVLPLTGSPSLSPALPSEHFNTDENAVVVDEQSTSRTVYPVDDPDGDGRPGRTLHPKKEQPKKKGGTLHPIKEQPKKKGRTLHPVE